MVRRNVVQLAIADLTEARRAAKRDDWLARIRTRVPERRPLVRYGRAIVWRQYPHLACVLEVKAMMEINQGPTP